MKQDRHHGSSRASPPDAPLAALCGLLAFLLYLATLAPTVLYYSPRNFDSAHLQVVASVLGIPSYTGYPTYAMLAHLFTYLPFGDPAYRVNLASAVFAAFAVAALYLLCRRLGAGCLASAAGTLAFGLSRTFWGQAVIAEVYTLHMLSIVLFLFALLLWRERRRDRHLLLAAFLGALALTNHLTSLFSLPAGLLFIAATERRSLARPRLLLAGSGTFLLGLLPYLYLPVRASMDPPLVGAGPAGDPSTLSGFLDLVSGGEHKGRILAFGPEELPERLGLYLSELTANLNPALLALALVGLATLGRRDRAALALFGTVFALNLGYALEYDIEDVAIYFIPTYFVLAIFLAFGASVVIERARKARLRSVAALLVAGAVAAGLPGAHAASDRSDDYHGREIVETVAQSALPGSTVLYHGRSLHYMQLVEGRREDLRLVDPFYTADWVERAERALQRGPVYVLYPGATNARLFREAGYELIPAREGMLYRVVERQR